MTQVVSISANTAALNIETLKHSRRLSVKDQVKDIKGDADRNLRRAENAGDPADLTGLIPAAGISIDLMTSGQQPRQQATFHQAQSAYHDLDD